ncbi:GntR family transcriptional regulator [Bordetella sp. BOR01]|uniref:GntR family transcriptional regulator n=1 Tax=Bordetella sp. BOR01 TaxID=2854779 RepID=UPI001C493B17|nr:GntR family transcriptional regulator [Bordetella sp. BOR01]MBV7483452.1 GntR family transcriptional regulator [Bordetella sp. BOR01]
MPATSPSKPSAPAVKKLSTADVVSDLRHRIASHNLLPGTHMPEEDIALTYNIPRAKAREALATLEDRGLIVRIPNKGAVIVSIDMASTYQLYLVREALDGLAVRLATENTQADDWRDIEALFGEPFEASLRNGDIDGHIATIETFRGRVKEAADNPALSDMIDRLHDRTAMTIRRVALLPGRAEEGIRQYRAVIAAMRQGDAEQAEARIRELNRSARDYIKKYKDYVF